MIPGRPRRSPANPAGCTVAANWRRRPGRPRRCHRSRGGRAARWSRWPPRADRPGTTRRSRRLRPRRCHQCRGGRWCRAWPAHLRRRTTGRRPQCCRATVSIDVVVVLPLVPATATRRLPRITDARACDRCSTRSPRERASRSSTLSSRMAEEMTTVSAPARWVASWPMWTSAPLRGQGREDEGVLGVGPADGQPLGPTSRGQRRTSPRHRWR